MQQLLAVLRPAFAALDQGRKLRIREHDLGRVEAPAPKRAVMLDQLFLRDAAPFEDLQHLLVAVMQQPWTDTRLAVRSDEVDGPIPRGNVDQDTVHPSIVRGPIAFWNSRPRNPSTGNANRLRGWRQEYPVMLDSRLPRFISGGAVFL